jgi:hypothetical protein
VLAARLRPQAIVRENFLVVVGGKMRLLVASFVGAALALALAGCDPAQEYRYYSDGIGTDLPSPTIVADTQLQDVYLAALCEQAGLQFCLPPGRSPAWALIVQAGLNDIDQRCDAYLAWLDDKRRTKEPILNELHVVSAATQAIMAIAGVGVNPITIVGIAFGLASDTFMNIRSRLLLEIDKSTVETVVINGQNRYRIGLTRIVIDTRVAAVYALRSYLRICTPFTIENQINTTVALFERGAGPIAERNPLIDPAIVPSVDALIGSIPREGPRGPLAGTPGGGNVTQHEPKMADGLNDTERRMPQSTGKKIQANLCVAPTGSFDQATRRAISQAKLGANQAGPQGIPFQNLKSEIVSGAETDIFSHAKPCDIDKSGKSRGYRLHSRSLYFPKKIQ